MCRFHQIFHHNAVHPLQAWYTVKIHIQVIIFQPIFLLSKQNKLVSLKIILSLSKLVSAFINMQLANKGSQ